MIRPLFLPAVFDRLLEHPVLVTEPITHRRQLHCRHRIQEACRQTSQTAIAEPSVGLLFEQGEPIYPLLLDQFFRDRIEQKVFDVVGQRSAKQELNR